MVGAGDLHSQDGALGRLTHRRAKADDVTVGVDNGAFVLAPFRVLS